MLTFITLGHRMHFCKHPDNHDLKALPKLVFHPKFLFFVYLGHPYNINVVNKQPHLL